ncbi:MAG: hypothetical protein WB780_07445 [Candidatus Acidiferrales bacterium]
MFGIDTKKIKGAFQDFQQRLDAIKVNVPCDPAKELELRITNVEQFILALKDAFS